MTSNSIKTPKRKKKSTLSQKENFAGFSHAADKELIEKLYNARMENSGIRADAFMNLAREISEENIFDEQASNLTSSIFSSFRSSE